MRILGIDPGVSGALAVVDSGRVVALRDMPTLQIGRGSRGTTSVVNGAELTAWIHAQEVDKAVLERVHAMPKNGVSAMFQFGRGYGTVEGVLAALRVPVDYAEPLKWKLAVKLSVGATKDASRARAIQIYPAIADQLTRKKDDGRAEAVLIATAGLLL